MTRLRLNGLGHPGSVRTVAGTFPSVLILSILLLLFSFTPLVAFMFLVYAVVLTMRTRRAVREKYAIPPSESSPWEDCCCALFCRPCVVMQMARHTADYTQHPAACCTKTGLRHKKTQRPTTEPTEEEEEMENLV